MKEYLSQKGIEFKDYDVGTDIDKAREMVEKTGQMGVPVIIVDGEIIIGFNQSQLDRVIAQ